MKNDNLGICAQCNTRVPAEFFRRDGEIWIRKHCPDCGSTESRVSSRADVWQRKRDLWDYVPLERKTCRMNCDTCDSDHKPNIVFVDVTNRCNMNCPICIATIKGMGFDFNPPLEYFDTIFADIARMEPKPVLLFFGGEPTVRNDLLDIISTARKYKLRPHVVTNGIRLADEDYCKTLCEARVPLRFAFDGRNADIYEKLRHNRPAYDKKVKALDNLRKFSRRKHTIMVTIGKGFNDQYVEDLFEFFHENRDLVSDVGMIPLTENWEEGSFDAAEQTTMEDVETIIEECVSDGEVEFIPAGLSQTLRQVRSFFRSNSRSEVLLLAGVHPNCESMTLLVSDGKRYRGINHYLRKPFHQVAVEFASLAEKMKPKLERLDRERFIQRLRGQVLILCALLPWILTRIRFGRLARYPFTMLKQWLFNRVSRRKQNEEGSSRRRPRRLLRVGVFPFEEDHSIDAARLENCKAVFAYEDVEEEKVKYIPACLWYPYRNPILKALSEKYSVANAMESDDTVEELTEQFTA